ncbi:MAG: HAD-IA family hydrolase [Bacteroidaceae bacterium]|nr:HAD-IA family hydrolase [Bacteroidaceae bacterium]
MQNIQNNPCSCKQKSLHLKAVLFDMDGVLFDSMPYHAKSWLKVMTTNGLTMTPIEAYMNEGRTGTSTINLIYRRQYGKEATKELQNMIYTEKCTEFAKYPEPTRITGALELVKKVRAGGLVPIIVTGSGQDTLINRIERNYPNLFAQDFMVTAFDVKRGKPDPEPYLMALQKAHLEKNEAIVIENAPLGVESGHRAGLFTIAVNTGPLKTQVLHDAGADLTFTSMTALLEKWDEFLQTYNK